MSDPVRNALEAAMADRALSAPEALALLPLRGPRLTSVIALAGLIGSGVDSPGTKTGPERFTCGIINAKSGRCSEDCAFCAQSRYHTTDTPVYPLLGEEALLCRARELAERGVRRMGIVTSGAGPGAADLDAICAAARRIRREAPIELCASLGLLTPARAAQLKDAGFTSYHHNLETARSFYPSICTTHDYRVRCDTVRTAKETGLRVCSGGLFGLGETWVQRVELADTLRELDVDSIPINFLMPIAGTGKADAPVLEAAEGLGILALFRLMHPKRDIVICGGRRTTLGDWDLLALLHCANGMMVGDYLTEKGSPFERDMALTRRLQDLDGGVENSGHIE